MSLASSPTRPYLEFAVRLSGSPFKRAFAGLRPGDEVSMSGPISRFVLDEARPAVLVAGGIGVTPLKGMAEFAADRELPIPVRLLFSNAAEDEIVYRDELDALERQNPRFRVLHTLTQTAGPAWRGATGRIGPEFIRQAAGDLENPVYYVSGAPGMVRDIWRLLRGLGVAAGDVRVEAFRGYAMSGPTGRHQEPADQPDGSHP